MKSKEMRALFLAMAFSASTMTACGAYGAMEPDPQEETAYSTMESSDSEYADAQEELSSQEQYQIWEDSKEQKNGYEEATCKAVQYDRIIFQIPDYMQDVEMEDEDSISIMAEESDTDFACLTMKHETREISDGDELMAIDEIANEAGGDTHTVDITDTAGADTAVRLITAYEEINNETTITYNAYFAYRITDTEADLITVSFTTTGNCAYSYRDDFMKIIENSELAPEYAED